MSSINLRHKPDDRLLELGGGDKPVVTPEVRGGKDVAMDVRICYNAAGEQVVDIAHDLNEPLPLGSGEFDGVVSVWALEHVSWRRLPDLLAEINRVLKPAGYVTFVLPNTEAQLRYILSGKAARHKDGEFVEASRILFGDQDYAANSHACYFSPRVVTELLTSAGFKDVTVTAYGELGTDMIVEASVDADRIPKPPVGKIVFPREEEGRTNYLVESPKPVVAAEQFLPYKQMVKVDPEGGLLCSIVPVDSPKDVERVTNSPAEMSAAALEAGAVEEVIREPKAVFVKEVPAQAAAENTPYDPARTFDRQYFDGGKDGGGYQIYLDFPCHELTSRHVLARKPESVLELGCGRGYVLKRIQDAGIKAYGLEVSKHCYLSRVADRFQSQDVTDTPWRFHDLQDDSLASRMFDLCLSVAVLEHIPEDKLPSVIKEMERTCRRGLHGVFFCPSGKDGDGTKRTLRPKEWWLNLFHSVAPSWPCEIVAKDELEGGQFPKDVLQGDGAIKLNLGCARTMFHHNWTNVDALDESQFAAANGYKYVRHDLRNGLPFKTDETSLIYSAHCLEHLDYKAGMALLRECRRVIKMDGAVRIIVPDAQLLMECYAKSLPVWDLGDVSRPDLREFDELNAGCAECPTAAGKLWGLLGVGHASAYDAETLIRMLHEAGFEAVQGAFRSPATRNWGQFGEKGVFERFGQILRETLDVLPCLSLYVDAVPREI